MQSREMRVKTVVYEGRTMYNFLLNVVSYCQMHIIIDFLEHFNFKFAPFIAKFTFCFRMHFFYLYIIVIG